MSAAAPPLPASPVHVQPGGVQKHSPARIGQDFKYACTIALSGRQGERTEAQVLVNAHADFIVQRVTWGYTTLALPRLRIAWRDDRRTYLDRPALLTAVFGMPGEDFPFAAGVRIARGSTLRFEVLPLDDQEGEVDLVLHGIELRPEPR